MNKLLIIVICSTMSAYAQSPKQDFEKAEEFYKNGNFTEAVTQTERVKKSLGKSNPKVEALLFLGYYNTQDYTKAKVAYETLKLMVPDNVENSDAFTIYKITNEQLEVKLAELETAFKEEQNKIPPSLFTEEQYANRNNFKQGRIKKGNEKIQKRIKEEELYKNAKSKTSVSLYKEFLESFPKSDYYSEIATLLKYQEEEDLWAQSKNLHTVTAYYEYLSAYPKGSYRSTALQKIETLDKFAYEKAISRDTQESLKYYLNNYSRGKYRNAVKNALAVRVEYDVYLNAKNNNSIENYETYINQYSNGKYASEVNTIIQNSYYRFGNEALDSKNYTQAIVYYQKYIRNYPTAEYNNLARKKLKKSTRKSLQTSTSYAAVTYESQLAIGLAYGKLKKDALGFYTNLRVTGDVIGMQFKEAEIEVSEDFIPDNEKIGVASLSMGYSYPILYPVWLYVGGGANYQERFIKEDNGPADYFKVAGEKRLAFYPEGGLKVRIGKEFNLMGGVVYVRDELLYKAGIGFRL